MNQAKADDSQVREALNALCDRYWYPIFSFIRHRVNDFHQAVDLTQGFFLDVHQRRVFASADRSLGRFRDYLLGCCQNYLENARRYEQRKKRSPETPVLSIDFERAEQRFRAEPADNLDAEARYLREWVNETIRQTFRVMEIEYRSRSRFDEFEALSRYLTSGDNEVGYAQIAEKLGKSLPAIKKEAERFRKRFRVALRELVKDTVDPKADASGIDDEIREILAVLSRR